MASGWYVAAAIGLGVVSGACAEPPTADQVIEKCLATYDGVKTYQGALVIQIDKGDQKTRTTLELKAENGDKGIIARSAIHLTQSATASGTTTSTESLIIDNGTTVFTVDTKKKDYWEEPHAPDRISGMFRRLMENAKRNVSKLKVTSERLHDRPVYRISGSGVNGEVTIVIDRETYQIYTAGGSGGTGAARFRSQLKQPQTRRSIKPLDASAFAWSPPAGSVKRENGGVGQALGVDTMRWAATSTLYRDLP